MMLHVARIPGEGLAKGLAVTLRHMLRKSDTQQYPEVKPELPPRSRGVIALVEENCTVCMLCARECPDWCIYIDSHKETLPAPEGGRPRARNVLDRFAIDFSLCMYCGICIEVCPFDALFWSPEFEYSEYDIRDLIHEKDQLGEWAATVPPPPPHESGAEPPKEIAAASRPARPVRTAPRAEPAPPPIAPPPAGSAPTGPDTPDTTAAAGSESSAAVPGSGGSSPAPRSEVTPPPGAPAPAVPTPEAAGDAADSAGRVARPARREPPRPMRDVRSIRPPGSLPKKPEKPENPQNPENPEKKDGPEEDA